MLVTCLDLNLLELVCMSVHCCCCKPLSAYDRKSRNKTNFKGFLYGQVPDYRNFNINRSFRFYKRAYAQGQYRFLMDRSTVICGTNRCGWNVTINYNYNL